jgi:hypothetical protein
MEKFVAGVHGAETKLRMHPPDKHGVETASFWTLTKSRSDGTGGLFGLGTSITPEHAAVEPAVASGVTTLLVVDITPLVIGIWYRVAFDPVLPQT